MLQGIHYEHGDIEVTGCYKWECNDGNMNSSSICPPLNCPESEQQHVADTCCKFCKGEEKRLDVQELRELCRKGHVEGICIHTNYEPGIG